MSTEKAGEFLAIARKNMADAVSESVMRHTFAQHLPQIFPGSHWWVDEHARGAETSSKTVKAGSLKYGFVDTLIGATVIEYEANLAKHGVEAHAVEQVKGYIAGELNKGVPVDIIVGIVSDTVRWKAFQPTIRSSAAVGSYGKDDVDLGLIEAIDLASPSSNADELKRFLLAHLGRNGSRPLRGETLANDLGLESIAGAKLRAQIDEIEKAARAQRPEYGKMIDRLWSELVDSVGKGSSRRLGLAEYLDEFYLLTLAKIICANVLDRAAVHRSDDDLVSILKGGYFSGKGILNYVEYDLFGWLADDVMGTGMLRLAQSIQNDLVAYDFRSVAPDDLFGELLARLGKRSTRLILGQELTPPWLARKLVKQVAGALEEPLRMVDTACGSGAILIEAIREEKSRPPVPGEDDVGRARRIAACATGFDIDPLASFLAKTNWIIAMRDERRHLGDVTVPVFHADSLFAGLYEASGDEFVLKLDDSEIRPPEVLLTAVGRPVFDDLLPNVYDIAMEEAKVAGAPDTSAAIGAARRAISKAQEGYKFDESEIAEFAAIMIRELALLQRDGRNGLWAYVIRNTSRAAQSFAQFNALAINPPWLALSKIGQNPYGVSLDRLSEQLGVRPAGASAPHTELAIAFLLEGVRRYLQPGGQFGCILPSSVANGNHQNRFRSGAYASSKRPVALVVDQIWTIPKEVFKNDAIVLFGRKEPFASKGAFNGKSVSEEADKAVAFRTVTASFGHKPDLVVWTRSEGRDDVGFGFDPAPFRQGADLMPRTAWFHDFQEDGLKTFDIQPIHNDSNLWHLLKDAKPQYKDFRLPKGIIIEKEFVTEAVLSNNVTPFYLSGKDKMLIPAVFRENAWSEIDPVLFSSLGGGTQNAFEHICKWLKCNRKNLFKRVNFRNKLKDQSWSEDSYIALYGMGGKKPCAVWISPGECVAGSVVFDQTVYWSPVETLEEAAYLVGAINSPACAELIEPFQSKGQQGERHVHKLPLAITPRYDPNDAVHAALVTATLALEKSWRSLRESDIDVAKRTDPTFGNLATRRKWLTVRLHGLAEWQDYVEATAALYEAS